MDGNTRWARKNGVPSLRGHAAGADALASVVAACAEWRLPALTVFGFSSENWKRGPAASARVLAVARAAARQHAGALADAGVRLAVVGNRDALPASLNAALDAAIDTTEAATTRAGRPPVTTLTVALSYGGRADAAAAARALAAAAAAGELDPSSIDEAVFGRALALGSVLPPDLANVDLLIRTGGERRLSNFLLHEAAYAELVFLDELWPDVTPDVVASAFKEYAGRERRFGGRKVS